MNLHQKEFVEVKFTQRDRDLFNAGGSAPRRLRFWGLPCTLPCTLFLLHRPSPSHLSRGCFGKNVLKAKELGTLRAEGAPAPRARPPSRAFLALCCPLPPPPGTSRAPFLPHDAPCLPFNVFYSIDLTSVPPHTPKSWGPSRSPACPPYSPPLSHLSHAQVSGAYRFPPPRSAVSHLSTHLSIRPPVHLPRPTFPNFVVPAQGSGGAL